MDNEPVYKARYIVSYEATQENHKHDYLRRCLVRRSTVSEGLSLKVEFFNQLAL